jgi:hypothetical protein
MHKDDTRECEALVEQWVRTPNASEKLNARLDILERMIEVIRFARLSGSNLESRKLRPD